MPNSQPSSRRRELGRSGHRAPIAATTAMVFSAVATVISVLSGFILSWPDAGVDPSWLFSI